MINRKVCLLVNPTAGNGYAMSMLRKIEETLRNLSIHFYTIITENVAHAQLVVTKAVNRDECIAVLGGDGTARAVAGIIKKENGILAIIPAGRGNDLVRSLHLPLDPIAACQVLSHGTETTIDMARVNQDYFLGICSLGFDSIANRIANRMRFIRGRAVYLYAGLLALCRFKPIRFRVTIDGNTFEHVGYTVAVANAGNYGGGMYLAPHASLQDGLLDVVLIGQISRLRMLVNVPRVFKGTHINEPGFRIIRGSHVQIEADSQFSVFADGDQVSSPPVDIKIYAKALRVLVP